MAATPMTFCTALALNRRGALPMPCGLHPISANLSKFGLEVDLAAGFWA
jgi:hypothetical protein